MIFSAYCNLFLRIPNVLYFIFLRISRWDFYTWLYELEKRPSCKMTFIHFLAEKSVLLKTLKFRYSENFKRTLLHFSQDLPLRFLHLAVWTWKKALMQNDFYTFFGWEISFAENIKVQIFWEGHKNLAHLPQIFEVTK